MSSKILGNQYRNIRYPLNVEAGNIPYILFVGKPYQALLGNGTATPEQTSIIKIAMPPALNSSDSLNYDTSSMLKTAGVAEQLAAGNYVGAAEQLGLGSVQGLFGEGAEFFAATKGKQINPKESLIFKAPSLRTHSFTFNMFARNKDEAEAIKNIIKSFRLMAYPTTTSISGNEDSETIYEFPYEFSISMHPVPDSGFPEIPRVFCTSIETNYAGSGRVTFTPDNYFQSVELTLQFQDIKLLNDKNITPL